MPKKWDMLMPLLHLLPAVVVGLVIAVAVLGGAPVLAEVPQRLEALSASGDADVSGDAESADATDHVYEDGVYVGSSQGYGGLITVQVTVKDQRISEVEILDASAETASFMERAKAVIDRVLEQQTWEVDVVSGATYSSNGILGAIQNALTGEAVENEAPEVTEGNEEALASDAFADPDAYVDGVYTGSAQGFGGLISVQVTITDGVIADISILSASGETPDYMSRAQAVISSMLSANSPNVDVVSGATYSSNGIINAVKRALAQAVSAGGSTSIAEEEQTPANHTSSNRRTNTQTQVDFPDASDGYVDGVYTGSAEGFGDLIEVQVRVSGGKISEITVLDASAETPSYFQDAISVISAMTQSNSPNVDTVSGATYSSAGIINAVKDALKNALAQPKEEEPDQAQPTQPQPDNKAEDDDTEDVVTGIYEDGVYTATVPCTDDDMFSYTIWIQLTIESGQITDISAERIDDISEDPDANDTYFLNAFNGRTLRGQLLEGVASQVLNKQSAEGIDVVSRATYSSNAMIEGVQEILKLARRQ